MRRSSRKRRAWAGPALWIVLIAAATLGVRCIGLDYRPVHGDEANQGYKAAKLLETGRYVYDPKDHHGPTLYYLALAPMAACGVHTMADAEMWMLRLVPVVFSAATALLFLFARPGIPPWAGVCASLILAFSPAFTFYSRYFIQEMLLVFFTFAALVAGWRYAQRPTVWRAIVFGLALCLMHATKETAVFAYAAMIIALAVTLLWRYGPREAVQHLREGVRAWHAGLALAIAAVVSITLFSALFTNLRGPLDSILTYRSYFERAGGAGIHDKPWYYYLSLLWYTKRGPGPAWSEGAILILAALGIVIVFWKPRPRPGDTHGDLWFLRFLAIYTIVLTALYCVVPYKTPWTLLSFYFGAVVFAGVAAARAIGFAPHGWRRACVAAAFLLVLAQLGVQTYRAETVYAADVRNPYVYAHTSTALVELADRIDEVAAIDPKGHDMPIKVFQPDNDYWPLPWYLRRYTHVGYWQEIPADADADVIIANPKLDEELQSRLKDKYFGPSMYSLRPAVLREVYIRQDLWDRLMESRGAGHAGTP